MELFFFFFCKIQVLLSFHVEIKIPFDLKTYQGT